MKIYISVDLEGINGVVNPGQVIPGNVDYVETQAWVADEINSIADGLFEAGVDSILVNDSHHKSRNIRVDELRDGIDCISGDSRKYTMMHGLDNTFDGVVLLGYHAKAGTRNAIMDHTYYSTSVMDIRINGVSCGEIGMSTKYAAELGIPVIMLSGDKAAVEEIFDLVKNCCTVAVKDAQGRFCARCLPFSQSLAQQKKTARVAAENIKKIDIPKNEEKLFMEITFISTDMADCASLVPASKRIDSRTVGIECRDMKELFLWRQVLCAMAESGIETEF